MFATDRVLVEAVKREGAEWATDQLSEVGRFAGSRARAALGPRGQREPAEAQTHDRFGHRIDEVEFHPAWHELMEKGIGSACTRRPGPTRSRAPTSPAPRRSCASPRPRPGSAARSR